MNVIERLQELRARSPKAFDIALAVIAGMIIAYVMTR